MRAPGPQGTVGVVADKQRARVYAAESLVRDLLDGAQTVEAFGVALTRPDELRFGALEHAQAYVDRVLARVRPDDCRRVTVTEGHANLQRRAYTTGHVIVLPRPGSGRFAWRELVLLHEIAHVLTVDGHGPVFCRTFIDLADEVMGPETGWLLATSFFEHGVDVAARVLNVEEGR